jgi:nucleoside-diphosphate-sugar epimerase
MPIELEIVMTNTSRINCIITGANGYLGSNLVVFLKKSWNIIEFVRNPKKKSQVLYSIDKIPDIKFFKNIDLIIHTAYDKSNHALNLEGYKKLLDKSKKANVKKVIFISSISAFQGCISEYGKIKLEMEKMTIKNYGINIKPGLIYGCGTKGILGNIKKKLENSYFVPIVGHGNYEVQLSNILTIANEIKYCISSRIVSKSIIILTTKKIKFIHLLKEISRTNKFNNFYLHIPFQLIYYLLKLIEFFNIDLQFKSDSILGLITPVKFDKDCIIKFEHKHLDYKEI